MARKLREISLNFVAPVVIFEYFYIILNIFFKFSRSLTRQFVLDIILYFFTNNTFNKNDKAYKNSQRALHQNPKKNEKISNFLFINICIIKAKI